MRLLITVLLSIIFTTVTFSQTTYIWTGAVNSNFSAAGNWNPSRQVGLTSDILIIESGGNLNIINVNMVTVGQLKIRNNSIVTLSPASGNSKTLEINGGTGEDLVIESGSELSISANSPSLSLFIKTGATASIDGKLSFTGSALGTLNGADSNSIKFNSGSVFTQSCPGNIFTSAGTKKVVEFRAGSTFRLNNSSALNPFGYSLPDSKIQFEYGSNYDICVTNPNALPLCGRNYSNLLIESNVFIAGNENFFKPANINDITVMNNGSLSIKNSNNSTTGELNIKGNINVLGYLCFADTLSNNKNISLNLNGNNIQAISGNGYINFTNLQCLRVENNLILYRNLKINCPAVINAQINCNGYVLSLSNQNINVGTKTYLNKIITSKEQQADLKLQNNTESPESFSISQNYPNPFNPTTKIDYQLAFDSKVSISVFDINGREVSSVVDKSQNAGTYSVAFDGSNLSSGVYFYKLIAEGNGQVFSKTMKMILVK